MCPGLHGVGLLDSSMETLHRRSRRVWRRVVVIVAVVVVAVVVVQIR